MCELEQYAVIAKTGLASCQTEEAEEEKTLTRERILRDS